MTRGTRTAPAGAFDLRYAAFLETVAHLRAPLHRYCARMTGAAMDGEDVMQEALLEAYRKLEQLDDVAALRQWLFRIAHNRCIDHLRRRRVRARAEAAFDAETVVIPPDPPGYGPARAIERLVIHLPPKERACVLLKDVLDYSLEEIAALVGSTSNGVKAALARGRAKLAALPPRPEAAEAPSADPTRLRLLQRYVELFNRRDWEGVRSLTSADARLRVSDCFDGRLADSPYFVEYERGETPWRMHAGLVEGEAVLLVSHLIDGAWQVAYPVRIEVRDGLIGGITDYYACPWLLPACASAATRFGNAGTT